MNQKNPKSEGFGQGASNFDSGFGGSQFGGGGGSQFGGGGGGGTEFGGGSAFGGTNAVSQIFKEGGFDDGKRKRIVIISAAVAAVVVCGGAAWWLFSGEDKADNSVKVEQPVAQQPKDDVSAMDDAGDDSAEDDASEGDDAAADDGEVADDAAAPATAVDNSSFTYDARQGGIAITVPDGARIEVSRSADFSDSYATGMGRGGRFQIPLPPPGNVYWRQAGAAETHAISVLPPPALSLNFSPPQSLSQGGQISWSANGPASYYRVEFASDAQFSNIVSVFATTQTSTTPKDLSAGKYFVRVGGYNLAAAHWEYSNAANVDVQ